MLRGTREYLLGPTNGQETEQNYHTVNSQDEDGQVEENFTEDGEVEQFHSVLAETEEAEKYVKLIMDLQPYVEKLNLPVPMIVVFGDQSAGKSALIRRLTNNLPLPRIANAFGFVPWPLAPCRGADRCTTGPIEIHMIKSQKIRERSISLRFLEGRQSSQPVFEFKFCDITAREQREIGELLTDCQVLVRNPTLTLEVIRRNNPNRELQLRQLATRIRQQGTDEYKFTNNVISITISGPAQPFSLSLVDLPGLVSDIREDEITVKDMVRRYIRKEHTILLPIFNVNNDIQNQSAWQLLKDKDIGADRKGVRTVGVLSRADELSTSREISKKWASLFSGEAEHKLAHGFYLIKNPSSEELERQHDADQLEETTINNLFTRTEWARVPRERMGLHKLVKMLSKLQMRALQLVQMETISKLDEERNKLRAELKSIEPPEGDPISAFTESIHNFCTLFRDHANTDSLNNRLYQGQLWNLGQYDLVISNTCPLFNLHAVGKKDGLVFDPVRLGVLQPSLFDKIKGEINAEDWSKDKDAEPRKIWNVEDVRHYLVDQQGGMLVGFFPYKAVAAIVKIHTAHWEKYAQKLLDKNFEWVKYFVNRLVEESFHLYSPRVIGEIQ
ncbi:P-loop containing nucleoside triphosphate hydrolase protein [Endogone sp. FLAS-F59071]|nr:P-loop containing nucleoside triphosphate hydrolase protein [Endogone sp. FLAS-F59071]|eukprot:RUS20844.1 P-loop containing nucleoside triphosphate hydrolase protein [Endogone sp. FLAS-F59071]